jgi:RNA polymerase sigma-70 factor, ECF subfamily
MTNPMTTATRAPATTIDDLRLACPAPYAPVVEDRRMERAEITTEQLVDRARAGDREAYAMLFERFHDEIYRFATRRLGDPASGQDVAAETFEDAFKSIHRFSWRGARFESWLYTIARRRIADVLRARARADRASAGAVVVSVRDPATGVIDTIRTREAIARLPEGEREVIELRFMEDLDVEETAARLGRSAGAVRVAQHRGLQRLRTMLNEGVA